MEAMHIGDNIRRIRKERGLHAWQLAEHLGKGTQAVFRLEKGVTKPRVDVLERVADFLGVTLADLVRLPSNPETRPTRRRLAGAA